METMNFHIGYTNLVLGKLCFAFRGGGGGGGSINDLAPMKNCPGMQCRLIGCRGKINFGNADCKQIRVIFHVFCT